MQNGILETILVQVLIVLINNMRLIFKSYCIRQFVLTFVIFFVVHAVADSDVKSKVALCSACHGETGVSFNQEWPNLAGQHVSYLIKQLQDYQQHARKDAVMNNLVASEQRLQ